MARTGSKHTETPDLDLIREALAGNSQKSYNILYARYHDSVFNQIRRYVSDLSEAEDICQETFTKAFGQLGSFHQDGKFATWIFAIAKNTALDHIEHDKARGKNLIVDTPPEEQEGMNILDTTPSPEEEVIREQNNELILECIQGLPDLYREIMVLLHVDHLGYNEIAQKVDLPLNTVKTRIRRAKDLITRMIMDME